MRLILFILSFMPLLAFSQTGSLTIFSENAQPFFLYLNDVKQNETAKSTVMVEGLKSLYTSARIVFSDLSIPPIFRKNISLVDENDHLMHTTYRLKIGKDRDAKLQFYSMNRTIQGDPLAQKKEKEIVTETIVKAKEIKVGKINEGPGEIVSLVKSDDKKVSPRVKGTSSGVKPEITKKTTVHVKKCTGWPIVKQDFEKAKINVIAAKGEANRLAAAKAIVDANCLMVSQVIELGKLLLSENSKITFAKFAYAYTIDRHNYPKLKELFKEQSNLNTLEEISKQR